MSLKAAFEKAGYRDSREEWPSDELIQVAVRAMSRHADDTDATQHAIMRACRNDAALLRQLMLPWWRQCTASLIAETRCQIRRKEQADQLNAQERRAAKVISLIEERELAREAKQREEELARIAEQDRYNREELNKWLKTKARDFTIEERPFWQVSTLAARHWQQRQAQRARFVDLVLTGVPEDDRPISYYRRPDEVDDLWDQAYAEVQR